MRNSCIKMIYTPSEKKPRLSLFFLAVSFLFVYFSIPLFAQESTQTENSLDLIKSRVATVGKLAFMQDVAVQYIKKAQLLQHVETTFLAAYPAELAKKEAVYLRLMGFVDKIGDVRLLRKKILLDHVRGVYDPKAKQLLVLNEYRTIDYINSMFLFHELRHALQDAHYSLAPWLGLYSDFDDRQLSVLAAIEGDATFTMIQCNDLDAGTLTSSNDADALFSFTPSPKPAMLYREPEIIKSQALMPYIDGLRFTNAVFGKKKWKGVNRILTRPPDSTEQILHPEKYLKREQPVAVEILYQPGNYSLYHSGVIGEYYLDVLLKAKDQDGLLPLARGWGGDTFHIYKSTVDTSYFLMWESMWDKEEFCSRFYENFNRFIEKHFNVVLKKGTVNGIDFVAGSVGQDYFFITRLAKKIFYTRSNNRQQMNTFIYGGNYD